MLSCRSVTLAVPGRVLCTKLEVQIEPGQIWAVLGRNGAGKSTLIHALAGLLQPTEGRIELDGQSLRAIEARTRARSVGVLLQLEQDDFSGTVLDYVLLGRFPHASGWFGFSRHDVDQASAALATVGMCEYKERRYRTLSGGERQRVRIAQILAQTPRFVLLDEPLQHLDLAHQTHVLALVAEHARERHTAVVMVLHEPTWIGRACTHALMFEGHGTVAAGRADQLLTRERLEHVYGCTLREIGTTQGRCFVPNV